MEEMEFRTTRSRGRERPGAPTTSTTSLPSDRPSLEGRTTTRSPYSNGAPPSRKPCWRARGRTRERSTPPRRTSERRRPHGTPTRRTDSERREHRSPRHGRRSSRRSPIGLSRTERPPKRSTSSSSSITGGRRESRHFMKGSIWPCESHLVPSSMTMLQPIRTLLNPRHRPLPTVWKKYKRQSSSRSSWRDSRMTSGRSYSPPRTSRRSHWRT